MEGGFSLFGFHDIIVYVNVNASILIIDFPNLSVKQCTAVYLLNYCYNVYPENEHNSYNIELTFHEV